MMAQSKDSESAKTTPKDKSKVFDVAKPGKSAAVSGSPAVVTKRSMVTDPTVTEDNPSQTVVETKEAPVAPSGKLRIEPLSKPEDIKPETKPAEEVVETRHDAIDDGMSDRDELKDLPTDQQELIDKKAAERQANFAKIALAKTYYLPINQVVRRRSRHIAVAGSILIIVLGLAWLDVSLDAGLLTIPGVEAPTHFFK